VYFQKGLQIAFALEDWPGKSTLLRQQGENELVAAYHIVALLTQSVCYSCFQQKNNEKNGEVSAFLCINEVVDIMLSCLIHDLINKISFVVSYSGDKLDFTYLRDSNSTEVDNLTAGEGDQDH
jgi:hypothetical protein